MAISLSLLTLMAWGYVIYLAGQMDMGSMDMTGYRMAVTAAGMMMTPAFQSWNATEFLFTVSMWVVMMIGMMTPSAAPMILQAVAPDKRIILPLSMTFTNELPPPHPFHVVVAGL